MSKKDRKRDVWVKEVGAPTKEEAFVRMDEWAHSQYDMYEVSSEPWEERDGYLKIKIIGWEYGSERQEYDC